MDSLEFNIKPQNLKYHCCTCLNKLSAEKYEMNDMTPELLQVLQQFADAQNHLDDIYPTCICAECYEKLEVIDEFQRTTKKSMLFLEELLKSFKPELNSTLLKKSGNRDDAHICDTLAQTEKLAVHIESCKFKDPLLCNDGFEEVLIKPEISELDENLDFRSCLNEFLPYKLPDEQISLIDVESTPQNAKRCFQCDKCELSFDKKRQLNKHINEEHEKSFTQKIICKFGCGKTFRLMPTAEKHYKKAHQNSTEINSNIQNETIPKEETFAEGEANLDSSFSTESKLNKQNKAKNKDAASLASIGKTTCPICLKKLSSNSSLNMHMRTHLDARPFPCDKCDRGFNKKALLTYHLKEMHGQTPIEIVCKYGCGRVFQRQSTATNHYRLKHIWPSKGIKPDYTRVCEDCGKVFKNISILKEHQNIHLPPDQRPYKCDQCGKRFSMKKNLTMHLMRHAGIKNFECTICGLKTTTRRELRLHTNFHTKELRVECSICSKAFNSPANMKRHEDVVHKGIKKYSCHFCDEKFGKPDTLKHHEMRHTGERPHKCDQCNKSFIQFVALKAHMKTHNKPAKLAAQNQHVVVEGAEDLIDVRQLL